MTEPRVPPYPTDTRARGWRFEVDMETVKASDTWLRAKTGEVRGALMLLWGEAWQQTPCGSLPADDELVALIIDMPEPKFQKNRAVLMRGWWLATDGRLYHDTIVERVLAMLEKRAKDAERSANRRARQAGASGSPDGITDASRVTHAGVPPEFDTKHQAPSTLEDKGEKPPRKRVAAIPCPEDVDSQVWEDWLTLRRKKSAPVTATVIEGAKSEAEKAGMTLTNFLRVWCTRGSQGMEADWLKPAERAKYAQPAGRHTDAAEDTSRMLAERNLKASKPAPEIRARMDAILKGKVYQ
jgi:hypothetical protein